MPSPAEYLGRHVRVWDAQHAGVFCVGKVVAVQKSPSIVIEDDAGGQHHHGVNLPIDVLQWAPSNHGVVEMATDDLIVRTVGRETGPAVDADPVFLQQQRAVRLQTIADVIWHMSRPGINVPELPAHAEQSDNKRWVWAQEVAEQVLLTEEAADA